MASGKIWWNGTNNDFVFLPEPDEFLQRNHGALAIAPISSDTFNPELLDAYVITDGVAALDLARLKEVKKTKVREERVGLLAQLDVEYFIESANIYSTGTFQRTPAMDLIMAKKSYLRNLPTEIDALNTIEDVLAFEIDLNSVTV